MKHIGKWMGENQAKKMCTIARYTILLSCEDIPHANRRVLVPMF